MKILVYILTFLSSGLVIASIVETILEGIRFRRAAGRIYDLETFSHLAGSLEPYQYEKVLSILDTLAVSDLKYSKDFQATLKTLKKLDFPPES